MKKDYERLEGTYKISSLKRLERMAYLFQSIGIIAVFTFIVYLGGPMLKPFYLPLFWGVLAALIWIFILSIEAMAFRLMEIRRRESESAKFLMADRSTKKAFTIIVVAFIAFAITFVPFFTNQIANVTSREGEVDLIDEKIVQFTSTGRFNFLRAGSIHLEITGGGDFTQNDEVRVDIISEDNYNKNKMELRLNGGSQDPQTLTLNDDFDFEMPEVDFEEYYIVLDTDERVTISYEINNMLPGHITYSLSIIFLAFMISQGVWAYMLNPIKKKHSDKAIYR